MALSLTSPRTAATGTTSTDIAGRVDLPTWRTTFKARQALRRERTLNRRRHRRIRRQVNQAWTARQVHDALAAYKAWHEHG